MKAGLFFKLAFISVILPLCMKAENKKIELDVDYTTELQYNFQAKYNWVNLLSLELDINAWKNGYFTVQTISAYKTSKQRIADDLQVFSNIETDNMWANLFMAGYTHVFDSLRLFAGIRNVNRDYFTSEYTSIFTNSSCGVYPTISANFPFANYPYSAMCLYGEFHFPNGITIKNGIYDGIGRLMHDGSFFSVDPFDDGIFNIFELSYAPKSTTHYGFYSIGGVLGTGSGDRIENSFSEQKYKNTNYALWGNVEQSVFKTKKREVGFMLQGSFAPKSQNYCINYFGAGTILTGFVSPKKKDYLCFFINRAAYHEIREIATEFTWQYPVNSTITIQPTFDYILTGKKQSVIALLRVYVELRK